MTRPVGALMTDDYEELRRRWLVRYLKIQGAYDTKLRTVLIASAEDAHSRISALNKNQTWSVGVKQAQLRLVIKEMKEVLNDLYKQELKLIINGQKESAVAAIDAFSETDRNFLRQAFTESAQSTGTSVDSFISGQRRSASLGVANAISRIYKTDQPLSVRVYHSRALANKWVQQRANIGILRGASAKEIATDIRRFIRPNTPGGVSYAALRLSRTELNNAFHATSIVTAQDRPWVEGMAWHTSQVHEIDAGGVPEICDTLAGQVFTVDNVPKKPHPQCLCYVTPEVEAEETFLRHLTAGQYRSWIANAA